jgi:hypothetical protein
MVRVPEAEPTTAGEKLTEMMQLEPAAIGPVQVFVWLNGPVTVTAVTCMGPVPLSSKVTVRAALVVPIT